MAELKLPMAELKFGPTMDGGGRPSAFRCGA
jgi:hypothetical protein